MPAFKEIVTKAIIGKGKKYYKNSYTIETENIPTTVLGCWVINHKFKGSEVGGKIVVDGSFDVNIWYSYDNDTKTTVITKKIPYSESVMVRQRETTDSTLRDIVVRSLKQPNCINAKENGKSISIEIEKELAAGNEYNLSIEEKAFFDALGNDPQVKELMKDETLVKIAKELVDTINSNMTIDWDIRKDARARMRYEIKKLLIKYDYPPVKRDSAVQLVIRQAELQCKGMIEKS